MKKVIILFFFIGGAIVFSSCNKDITCTQKVTVNGTTSTIDVKTYKKLTREEKNNIEHSGTFISKDNSTGAVEAEYVMECKK